MELKLTNIGKRYRREWIFKGIDHQFHTGQHTAITGPNGAGKSTLIAVLSGFLTPSKGKVQFSLSGKVLAEEESYKQISIAAPYIDLIEEFSLKEAVAFHAKFKPLPPSWSSKDFIDKCELSHTKDKQLRYFSSGMKQRVKLALAICAQSPLLLLDEPTTNLDEKGAEWYQNLITEFKENRTIFVASNVAADFQFCSDSLSILDYKTAL